MKSILVCFLLYLFPVANGAKIICDTKRSNIIDVFNGGTATYVIHDLHQFSDTLFVPHNSVIRFEGGGLSGPIVFNNTELSGLVNLKGSSIRGTIRNEIFDASWQCVMDGVTDDAKSINEMIEVCGHVYFPKGTYRLISRYNPTGKVSKKLHKSINAHIGICKSNVELIGELGTNFVTNDSCGTICVFSKPNKIEKSTRNINIKSITFNVHNDGVLFHEFLHTIKTIGVNGLTIEDCIFNDFWGDAICLSHYGDNPKTGERTRNQSVIISNNTIIGGNHHNNRNGISVINGKDVIIRGNTIKNSSRKDMPGGIDIEPNNKAYTIENIRIEKNYIEGSYGNAIMVYIKRNAHAHCIKILSNEIKNCLRGGIAVGIKTDDTTDSIIIQNNHVHSDTRPYRFGGKGHSKDWIVCGNMFDRPIFQTIPGDITVENLVVKNKKKRLISWVIECYWQYIASIALVGFIIALFVKCKKMRRIGKYVVD